MLILNFILFTLKESKRKGRQIPEHCDVAIVGAGIGGLYMAEALLRHEKETNVCVFERDTRLGGRIYDYVFPQVPDVYVGKLFNQGKVVGVGRGGGEGGSDGKAGDCHTQG